LRRSRGKAARRATAVATACALAVLIAACSQPAAGPRTRPVLLTSGTSHGVWWGVWAWEDTGSLCLDMGGRGGPNAVSPPPQDAAGGECGFSPFPGQPGYYDSGPGPAGGGFVMGPLPDDAVQIRVSTKEVLPTEPLAKGVGLPAGRYWVEIIPPTGLPAIDGQPLNRPQPLNAAGQVVPFKKF
jgi:hypothetical protein